MIDSPGRPEQSGRAAWRQSATLHIDRTVRRAGIHPAGSWHPSFHWKRASFFLTAVARGARGAAYLRFKGARVPGETLRISSPAGARGTLRLPVR